MSNLLPATADLLPVSQMAETLIGSEIIKLAAQINQRIDQGETIYNFTIGDFDPTLFPIPDAMKLGIMEAYTHNETNYPDANGMEILRKAVAELIQNTQQLNYPLNEILISCGGRPLIYALYRTILDAGDQVVFPVPSWNNNHYTHLSGCNAVMIETSEEDNFMPTAQLLAPHLNEAALLALCSPLNPTGTVFGRQQLFDICQLVLTINKKRSLNGQKPLYVLYDQIYSALTFGQTQHHDPVTLCPDMRPYTIFVDGVSKAFAATGVRVGWAFGPQRIVAKMRAILSHVGAWPARSEQLGVANFLNNPQAVAKYSKWFKAELYARLDGIYKVFKSLNEQGYPVKAIAPQAAIYLTVKIDLKGKTKPNGEVLTSTAAVTDFILQQAGIALVPFYAFGSDHESTWYRLSVGTCQLADIDKLYNALRNAMDILL